MPEDEKKGNPGHAERIRAVEVRVNGLNSRMDRFEGYCKETQEIYRESFASLNERLQKFLNNEVHDLQEAIASVKKIKRDPLSAADMVKIAIAVITVTGSVIIAAIQFGLI